jgi:hypothetical protein
LLLCSCISQNNANQSLITKKYHMSVEHQTCSSYARLGTSSKHAQHAMQCKIPAHVSQL